MFSLICAWINGWVNNHETGDLRRHRTHNDVIVMTTSASSIQANTYDMVRHILAHGRTYFAHVTTLVGPATRTILVSTGTVCDRKLVSLIFNTWNILRVFSPYIFISSLTHLSLDKIAAISQTIFTGAFSWMKSFAFWLKFHWSLFINGQITTHHRVR